MNNDTERLHAGSSDGQSPPPSNKPSLKIFSRDDPEPANVENHQRLFAIGVLPSGKRLVLEFFDGPVVIVDEETLTNQKTLCALLKCQLGREYEPINQQQWELDLGRAFYDLGWDNELAHWYLEWESDQELKDLDYDRVDYGRWV